MATFPGFRPTHSPNMPAAGITPALDAHATNQQLRTAMLAGLPPAGRYASQQPTQTRHGPPYSGTRAGGYLETIYNRLHLVPLYLNLGNVVTEQVREIHVWNAYFAPRRLSAIERENDEGVSLSGQSVPPFDFAPLQERKWRVGVSTDGPPVVDSALTWLFAGEPPLTLTLNGNRITAWTLPVDWRDGVTERLGWLTELLTSPSGVEQRRALRLSPRRTLEAAMLASERERVLLDLSLYGWGGRIWAVPVWNDVQRLSAALPAGATEIACDTRWRDFRADGMALLRGESAFDYEVVAIRSAADGELQLTRPLQRNWLPGTALYPMRPAQLVEQPRLTRLTDRLQRVEAQFSVMEACDWPEAMPATSYRGWPVFEQPPDESEELTSTWQRLQSTLDNLTSLPAITDTAGVAFPVQSHRWRVHGREEQGRLRSLLYALRGRQQALWLPTHADDLQMITELPFNGTVFDIRQCGYSRFFRLSAPGRRDIRIETGDGEVFHRRVVAVQEVDGETERVSIDTALGRTVAPEQIQRISFMMLCRLDQDDIEIHHLTDSDGVASVQAIFRGVRDELQ